jgi:CheY-like chemotaxis protein/phosphoribosyl 1,2-cyclic phosphodiesterase
VRIRFWGTRGSLAKPGPTTLRYGGNTSCVEVRAPDGTLIVLDCGTGAHELGRSLVSSGSAPWRGHLLVTHTHWDHIQGFPFFAPLFTEGQEWDVYAPEGVGQRLEAVLAGQMEYAYFPLALGQLKAVLRCHGLAEGSFHLGAVRVTTRYLNHPGLTLGYRLEVGGVSIVYATDHEPHSRHHPGTSAPAGAAPRAVSVHPEDRRHVEFLAGADLVIHDAQYTLEEYPAHLSWGHTPAELAVDFALAAGAKRLALHHHDPTRDDGALDRLLAVCRHRVAAACGGLEVFGAAEGLVLELAETRRAEARQEPGGASIPAAIAPESSTILVVDDDKDVVDLLIETLSPEGFRVLTAGDGETALRLARAHRPDLLLLDWHMPGQDGLEVCRALRADADLHLREVPVVLVTADCQPEDTARAFDAGVTDFVTKPFKPTYILSRVQAWLLRGRRHHAGAP